MAIREIRYNVTPSGVIPAYHLWGGVQNEDNATNVVYVFDSAYLSTLGTLDNLRFRIDFNSASAGYEPSENLTLNNSRIERAIPQRMTQYGGQMECTLVISRIIPENLPEVSEVILQIPSIVFFTASGKQSARFDKNLSAYEEHIAQKIAEINNASTEIDNKLKEAETAAENASGSAAGAATEATNAANAASTALNASSFAMKDAKSANEAKKQAQDSALVAENMLTLTTAEASKAETAANDAGKACVAAQDAAKSIRIYNPASINKHYSDFIAGTISASGVITEEYNGGSTQYFIKQYLEAGTYLYRTNYNVAGVASRRCFRYDENGAYLGSIVCEVVTDLGNGREIDKFTLPEGRIIALRVGYIDDTDDFMIIEGSTPEDWSNEYVPYYPEQTKVADDINFGNSMKEENDVLWGKSIAVEGDSICAGNNIVGGYSRWLQYEHNMTVYNSAVGGSPITNVSGKPHIISEAIANMQAGCDYYIFNGGYNDRTLNVTVGELVDGFPLKDADNDTITTDTLAGAMEYACRDLVTIHNGAKCGFIFCHNRYSLNDDYNTKYRAIMKSACEKWGVPYLDLQEQVPPFAMIQSLANKYTQSQDGTHPNWEGYEKYYVPKIVAWLKTL